MGFAVGKAGDEGVALMKAGSAADSVTVGIVGDGIAATQDDLGRGTCEDFFDYFKPMAPSRKQAVNACTQPFLAQGKGVCLGSFSEGIGSGQT